MTLDVGEAVCELVPVGLTVALDVGVPVCEPVDDLLAVTLDVGEAVCEFVPVQLAVGVELGVPVASHGCSTTSPPPLPPQPAHDW